MIRSVRISSPLNKNKLDQVHEFLEEYQHCVNYFITRLWAEQKFNGKYLDNKYIDSAKQKFNLTARLIQCAGKQAFEIVKSQRKKSKRQRTMPRFKKLAAILDSRFWEIAEKRNSFEWVKLQSGFTFHLPFKKTKIWNKWADKGFTLSKTIRVTIEKINYTSTFYLKKKPLN